MSNNNPTDSTQNNTFERVTYNTEKTLYPDPPNDIHHRLNSDQETEQPQMNHRISTHETKDGSKSAVIEMVSTLNTNEKEISSEGGSDDNHDKKNRSKFSLFHEKYKVWFHVGYFIIFTGFLAAAYALQVPKGYNSENLILGLCYAFFCLKMIFTYIPFSVIYNPCEKVVTKIFHPYMRLPKLYRTLMYGAFLVAVIVITVFSIAESPESPRIRRLIGLLGLFLFLLSLWCFSTHRRKINWNTVFTGILTQFLLALFVFRCSVGHDIFNWLSTFAQGYLSKAFYGTQFIFGDTVANAGVFAVSVFPTLIFFAATVQILYYYGALQFVLERCATFFMALLQVSGAESIVAVASPFLGQSENALLIKPFLPYLTQSEMHQIMCSGFATISGSVLYGYIAMGVSGQALLTSCIMSIPCSLVVSKMRMPEDDVPLTAHQVRVPPSDDKPANALHAAGGGAATGINIVLLMCANLISLLALLYTVNAFLTWLGNFLTIKELTLQLITGYVFVPIAWLIGADDKDVVVVGQLLATKVWANEFVAYEALMNDYATVLSPRSLLVTTYALCGFANLGSIGMQIGVLSTLAPKRSGDIARLALSACVCGAMSTWISAAIAGMLA